MDQPYGYLTQLVLKQTFNCKRKLNRPLSADWFYGQNPTITLLFLMCTLLYYLLDKASYCQAQVDIDIWIILIKFRRQVN